MEPQISVRLPASLLEKIDRRASRENTSRSDMIRSMLERSIEGAVADSETPYDRVRDLVGSIHDGPRDGGAAHRKHLIKAIRDRRGFSHRRPLFRLGPY